MKYSFNILLAVIPLFAGADDTWRFINLADWHHAEKYIFPDEPENAAEIRDDLVKFTALKENFGGELIVIPGDTNSGKWDNPKFIKKFRPGGKAEDSRSEGPGFKSRNWAKFQSCVETLK